MYRHYNLVTQNVRVSVNVVFDEMGSWYVGAKLDLKADVNHSVGENNVGAMSHVSS